MKIEYSKEAAKYINKLDWPTKQRIKIAIDLPDGGVEILYIINVDSRGDIYK